MTFNIIWLSTILQFLISSSRTRKKWWIQRLWIGEEFPSRIWPPEIFLSEMRNDSIHQRMWKKKMIPSRKKDSFDSFFLFLGERMMKKILFWVVWTVWLVFCRTSLPLASARYVRPTFARHCPLSSKQCSWLTSATSTFLFLWNFSGSMGFKPGAAGSWSKFPNHCAMLPPLFDSFLKL